VSEFNRLPGGLKRQSLSSSSDDFTNAQAKRRASVKSGMTVKPKISQSNATKR